MDNQPTYKYIGQRRPLIEGREKVTGSERYAGDLTLPGMLHGRPILSPYAHATIVSIDASEAEALPGVVAVYTAEDLPTKDKPITTRNSAVLAKEKVVFVGQPVALVVAETAAIATDAAELVFIEYDPLPAATEIETAIRPESPTIWVDDTGTQKADHGFNNVSAHNQLEQGDIVQGFADADVIVEQTYQTSIVHQGYIEPMVCVAAPDPVDGSVTLYTSTQGKFTVRDEVAELLSLTNRQVRIVPMAIGGGFGAKYGILEPLAAGAALTAQRPVKIVLTRSEDLLTTTPAPPLSIELKTGAKKDGTLTALQVKVFADNGFYTFIYGHLGGIVARLMRNMYNIPHLKIDAYEVHTNKPPVGAYRAPAGPPTIFALESNMADMVEQLGLDPVEFRLKNAVQKGPLTEKNPSASMSSFQLCLERLKEHPMWKNRHTEPGEGIGLAVAGWLPTVGTGEAICRVDSDGSVSVTLGHVDVSGNDSSFVLIAAEALGVRPEDVVIVHGETTGGPYGPISGGSQVTYSVAGAIDMATQIAKEKLLDVASDHFEAAPEDIELVDGKAQVKGFPDKTIDLGQLATIARSKRGGPGPIVGEGHAAVEHNAPVVSIHLVKVRVDEETGQVKPLDYLIIQDVGKALNPLLVEGQMHGGMIQGLGIGLHEAMIYDNQGQLLSGSFMDYGLPRMDDVPPLETVLVEDNPSPHGPFGSRGVGEPPILGGAAAIANAIKDATGVRITTSPVRSEAVWQALKAQ
ncbi:MAG: xanthine dehydrogenase family protein molybdopterin-binding subunit [Chloroflexota bacterium]